MTTASQQRHAPRGVVPFLAAVIAALVAILLGTTASASASVGAETRVGAFNVTGEVLVEPPEHVSAGQHPGRAEESVETVVATGVAANTATGGAAAVRVGQAGEAAVRSAFDIGPKATVQVGTRTRILDGLSDEAVSEVKNVASQSFTLQLKDSLAYAQSTGRRFDLYVRRSLLGVFIIGLTASRSSVAASTVRGSLAPLKGMPMRSP